MTQELPDHDLTDEERGATTSRGRRIAMFAGVLVLTAGAVVGIAVGSHRTDHGTSDARPSAPSTTATTAAPAVDAGPDPDDVAQAQLVEDEDARVNRAVSRGTGTTGKGARRIRTIVLDRRDEGAYTLSDLVRLGAAERAGRDLVTLTEPVVVRSHARLVIDSPGLTLRMAGSDSSFASIVAWGGSLTLHGSASRPVTVVGWDRDTDRPDVDVTDGRGYVRVHSGRLDLRHAKLDHLGFWSGRTGGLAVTGTPFDPGRASVRDTALTDDHIGLYLYGTRKVTVAGSSVTSASRDGIELDRSSGARFTDVTVEGSGVNGLRVHDHSDHLRITGGSLTDNAGYGLSADGRPRASGPNALGYGVDGAVGLTVAGTTVGGNGSGGLLVAGTSDVTVRTVTVDQARRPLRVVGRSSGTTVYSSRLTSGRGPVVQVESGARRVKVTDSTITGTTTGVAVDASQVDVLGNTISVKRGNAVTATGHAAGTVSGNTVAGRGTDAFLLSRSASRVEVGDNVTSGWDTTHRVLDWIEHNPFAPLWVAILLIPLLGILFILRRARMHRELRRLTEETVIAMAKARRRGPATVPAGGVDATAIDPAVPSVATAVPAPVATTAPVEVTRTDRLVTRGAMGQFSSAEDLALHAVLQGGKSPERVARTLQVPVAVVQGWLRQHAERTQAPSDPSTP